MDIKEIIKNAFLFPSKNLETLSIYAILSLLSGAFAVEGIISIVMGLVDIVSLVIGIVCIIIAIILALITRRISIQCIRSGINLEEKLPDFNWWGSLGTGLNKIIVSIVYFFLPLVIVVIVALLTDVLGNLMNAGQIIMSQLPALVMGNVTPMDVVYQSMLPLYISLSISISVGLIAFLVFSFFQDMSEARLAHTGSLKNALNIFGAARDIKLIGVGKLLLLSILIFFVVLAIEFVLTFIFDHLIVLSILNIVITPYIALFSKRALGLLYSDIV